uniref:Defensin-like protein n=1 Tax=Elaeophora elaphi TaxID=1147741 RepID=A0A0R3S411_9BILA
MGGLGATVGRKGAEVEGIGVSESVRKHCGNRCSGNNGNSTSSGGSTYCSKILINFQIILIIFSIIDLINTKDIAQQRLGCDLSDHQACDELCKQDSYWYGHCSTWDGRDFTCSCYQYKVPLDGNLCKQMQRICKEYCIKKV